MRRRTTEQYLAECRAAIQRGEWPPAAITQSEEIAALREFPQFRHYWQPADAELRGRGLDPRDFRARYETPDTIPPRLLARLVRSFATDPRLRQAFKDTFR